MCKIAVVIPTFNRADNLDCVLTALSVQTTPIDELIVVDDGSTDNTHDVVMSFNDKFKDLKYYYHPNRGYRLSLNRNQGSKLVAKDTTHILYIDSDVMLNPRAIEAYHDIIKKHPKAVVCGRYDWLPQMNVTPKDVVENWNQVITGELNVK